MKKVKRKLIWSTGERSEHCQIKTRAALNCESYFSIRKINLWSEQSSPNKFRATQQRTTAGNSPRMSLSKKAQLGKIVSGFSIFIFLIVLMAIFILLSTGAAIIKHPTAKTASVYLPNENDLMFQPINVTLRDGSQKKVLVYDAVYLWYTDKLKTKVLKDEINLEQLRAKTGNCYYLELQLDAALTTTESTNKELTLSIEKYLGDLSKGLKTKSFDINGAKKEVKYYYGKCP
jgi:hypothetical protein